MVVVMRYQSTIFMDSIQEDTYDHDDGNSEMTIEARTTELMQHGEACDPMEAFNIIEALGEASTNTKMVLAKVLAERKFDQVGILVDGVSRMYWTKIAAEMAERELS